MGIRCRTSFLLLLALPLASCRQAKVETYRIPKEAEPQMPPAQAPDAGMAAPAADNSTMASTAVPTASGNALVWSAPADWKLMPDQQMRKATYSLSGPGGKPAELSITAFPGSVGGELANLNRWRGQVQLPPLDETAMNAVVTRVKQGDLDLTIADFDSAAADGDRVIGAIVPVDGSTWFFKVKGPKPVVEAQKAAFLAFLKTVKEPAQ